jgi:Flp pilus assembly protein TadD
MPQEISALQNVETSPQPYKKDTIPSAFLSLQALAAGLCMAFFAYSIPHFDADSNDRSSEVVNSPDIVDKAMALSPGVFALRQHNMDAAVLAAGALIEKKKLDVLANICAGNVYVMANMRDEGLKCLKKSVSLSHRNRYVIENYAEKLAETGKVDEAIEQYRFLESRDRTMMLPHMALARLFMDSERPQEAAEELKVIVNANDKNWEARKMRAICLARAGNAREGLDEYTRATIDEKQSGIPDAIKGVLGQAGAPAMERVMYELQQQINNNPTDYAPKLRMAQLYQFKGDNSDLQQAKGLLLDARQQQPNNVELQRTLALVLKQLGEDNLAQSAFAASVKLETQQEKEQRK